MIPNVPQCRAPVFEGIPNLSQLSGAGSDSVVLGGVVFTLNRSFYPTTSESIPSVRPDSSCHPRDVKILWSQTAM